MTQPNAVIEIKPANGPAVRIGNAERLSIIAGPCQLESRQHALETAHALKEMARRLDVGLIYKTSFLQGEPHLGENAARRGAARRPADLRRDPRGDRPADA